LYAKLLSEGIGVTANPDESVRYLRQSPDQKCAPAQLKLGESLLTGTHVAMDRNGAVEYYQRAAYQGHAES
jgi:TPR repeat protein